MSYHGNWSYFKQIPLSVSCKQFKDGIRVDFDTNRLPDFLWVDSPAEIDEIASKLETVAASLRAEANKLRPAEQKPTP